MCSDYIIDLGLSWTRWPPQVSFLNFLCSWHPSIKGHWLRPTDVDAQVTSVRDSVEFSHLMILLERSENLIRPLLLLTPLMSVIVLYHAHFTEVLLLPVFVPKTDSTQKFYRDANCWHRKRQGVAKICSAREEDGKAKITFYFLYHHHNCDLLIRTHLQCQQHNWPGPLSFYSFSYSSSLPISLWGRQIDLTVMV